MNINAISSRTILHILSTVFIPFLLLLSPLRAIAADGVVEFSVNFNDEENSPTALDLFWNGSGVNRQTADYTSEVMRQNMLLIGSISHQGSLYQRPHDLLELVEVSGMENYNPQYNWSELDKFLDIIVKSGQKLFFELMGNPKGYDFGNFSKTDDQDRWALFIKDLVLHLEKRFGKDEVRSWYFETWNEPNRSIPFGQFVEYYRASLKGLNDADKDRLIFGGPAIKNLLVNKQGKLILNPYLSRFLDWTKNNNIRLDYISYHYKNLPEAQVNGEIKAIDFMKGFQDKPFINDEADSEEGWWRNKEYRATPWYAAFIARNIDEHLTRIINGEKVEKYRLQNDNAFLRPDVEILEKEIKNFPIDYKPSVGAWKQRTHFAHFGDDYNNFALIKKPAHNVMTMLSLLGDKQYVISTDENSNGCGAIATKWRKDQVAILVYHYHDEFENPPSSKTVQLNLFNLPFSEGKLLHYRLDKNHSDTYAKWIGMGKPIVPDDGQLQTLRDIQELGLFKTNPGFDVSGDSVLLDFDLPSPGVSLIIISKKPSRTRPAQVTGLYAEKFTSLNGKNDEVLIRWDSNSRFIRNYKVFHSNSASGPFRKINPVSLVSTAYIHQLEGPLPDSGAYYRVSAVNYWGKTGTASDVFHVINETQPVVMIEAEKPTTVEGAWTQRESTDASGGAYMVVPRGKDDDLQCTGLALEHYMEYRFNALGDREHFIWVRGRGNGGGQDSVCVSVDDGPLKRLDIAQGAWQWQRLTTPLSLVQNSETRLKIHFREDNTYVDKLIITSNSDVPKD